jgi:hypothetical protein
MRMMMICCGMAMKRMGNLGVTEDGNRDTD